MTFSQGFLFIGCFWIAYLMGSFFEAFKEELPKIALHIASVVIIVLVSLTAEYIASGSIAPQFALSDSETYAVVGTPTISTTQKGKYIAVLRPSGGKEYAYLVENIPPPGFKIITNESGQEFFVPEKFVFPEH